MTDTRPVVVDFCCCSGGLSRGYQRAGFRVIGVDIEPQPQYAGDEFIQGDALTLFDEVVECYRPVAGLGSPPCQSYTPLNAYNQLQYPRLIQPLRVKFQAAGMPYVIENVPAARAELINPIEICAGALGLPMIRHRLFEAGGGFTITPPPHVTHKPCSRNGYLPTLERPWMSIHGGKHSRAWLLAAKDAMEMPWVDEIDVKRGIRQVSEAVPPRFGEFIGRQLAAHLGLEQAA